MAKLVHLIPFVLSLCIYFLIFIPMEHQTFFGMILKCLPIITLQYFVFMNGIGFNDNSSKYNSKILSGLIFACIGDAFLDFPNYFLHGTASFAIAQIFNIWAFGFKPLNLFLGLKVFVVMSLPLFVVTSNLMKQELVFIVVVSLYTPLLKTMVWRSIARVNTNNINSDLGKLCGCLGGISFGISDATLAINKFYSPVPYAQAIIMITYYLAQLGIAMSVLQFGNNDSSKPKQKERLLKQVKFKQT